VDGHAVGGDFGGWGLSGADAKIDNIGFVVDLEKLWDCEGHVANSHYLWHGFAGNEGLEEFGVVESVEGGVEGVDTHVHEEISGGCWIVGWEIDWIWDWWSLGILSVVVESIVDQEFEMRVVNQWELSGAIGDTEWDSWKIGVAGHVLENGVDGGLELGEHLGADLSVQGVDDLWLKSNPDLLHDIFEQVTGDLEVDIGHIDLGSSDDDLWLALLDFE
jgi:hypothetical protein